MKTEILIVSLFPLFGYILSVYGNKKILLLITSISLVFLLPDILSPYKYSVKWLHDILLTLMLSGISGFVLYSLNTTKEKKYIICLVCSAGLFSFTFFSVWFNAMAGSNEVLDQWKKEFYEVNYIESRGFSGRPLYYYELKKYGLYGIFEVYLDKHELRELSDTLCEVNLYDNIDFEHVTFNRCTKNINIR